MVRQGARVSLILAFVFPAIVCAAVALAYYGYSYAKASSDRSKTSLMEGNRDAAKTLTDKIQDRIDRVDTDLFEEIEWEDPSVDPPSAFDLPAGIESAVVLDEGLRIRSSQSREQSSNVRMSPVSSSSERARVRSYARPPPVW